MTAKVSLTQLKETTEKSLLRPAYGPSFREELDQAQTQLEEKRKHLEFLPWASLEKLFSNIATGYDYDTGLMGIEQDFNNRNLESEPPAEHQTSNFKPQNQNTEKISGSDLFKSDPQAQKTLENIITQALQLVPNLESSPAFLQASMNGTLLNKLDLRFLIEQIAQQVKLVKASEKTELSMNLKTADLEKILLSIVSKNGMIAINLKAPEETRKLLGEQIEELELALKKAHINLSSIKIEGVKNDLQSGSNT